MEAVLNEVTQKMEFQDQEIQVDKNRQEDLRNLANDIDSALKNLEQRLMSTVRSNIETQRFEYTTRIEESSRLLHEKIKDIQTTVNKQDLGNQRRQIL